MCNIPRRQQQFVICNYHHHLAGCLAEDGLGAMGLGAITELWYLHSSKFEPTDYFVTSKTCWSVWYLKQGCRKKRIAKLRNQAHIPYLLPSLPTPRDKERSRLFNEIQMLWKLRHKNILDIREWWYDESSRLLVFITEYLTDGSLRQ
jgi:hypothetical protein